MHQVSHHLSNDQQGTEETADKGETPFQNSMRRGGQDHRLACPAMNHSSSADASNILADCVRHLLLPVDDPVLEDDIVEHTSNGVEIHDEEEWIDEGNPWYDDRSSSDDDSNDFEFSENPRFIDSGWGGECLREIEDIDFEFVYALHTFVATVEGQANATKGDTMVLLDDSNSYWWLVRVVKDGSIGNKFPQLKLQFVNILQDTYPLNISKHLLNG